MTLRKMAAGAEHRFDVLAAAIEEHGEGSIGRSRVAEALKAAPNAIVGALARHILQIDGDLGAGQRQCPAPGRSALPVQNCGARTSDADKIGGGARRLGHLVQILAQHALEHKLSR